MGILGNGETRKVKLTLTVEQIGDLLARRPVTVNVFGHQYLIEMEPFLSDVNRRYLQLGYAVARLLNEHKGSLLFKDIQTAADLCGFGGNDGN